MSLLQAPPTELYRAAQVRALDKAAIDSGIKGLCLMERAGMALFEYVQQHYPAPQKLTVLCGLGNNAGDGYVIARLAHLAGYHVEIIQLGDINKLRGDAKQCLDYCRAIGLSSKIFDGQLPESDIMIDALLGTGLDRPVTGEWAALINTANASQKPIIAVDIPSGLSADTGAVLGTAIKAHATVSFIGLKQGLYTGAGRAHAGEILFSDLAVPEPIYQTQTPSSWRLDADNSPRLAPRAADGHKGHYGHVLVIGGDVGFSGAIRLAAEAAARTGAGKVSVATHPQHAAFLNMARPELMVHGIKKPKQLKALLAQIDVLAIGPGLGQSAWSKKCLAACASWDKPIVVDADALNLIAKQPQEWAQAVYTPHPGEAARLLSCATAVIQQDRFDSISRLVQQLQGVVVLKGSGSLISDGKACFICTDGNPYMASGGMGDVLTGMIAAFLAQGLSLLAASQTAVCLHAQRADDKKKLGLLASDIFTNGC